ncbi:hypothetical protein BDF19DRAFT_494712 [Syncephalis fuscata]|nr:hypothetical protein BDF19DRAFT_494712 [Syncephalis fuscata]
MYQRYTISIVIASCLMLLLCSFNSMQSNATPTPGLVQSRLTNLYEMIATFPGSSLPSAKTSHKLYGYTTIAGLAQIIMPADSPYDWDFYRLRYTGTWKNTWKRHGQSIMLWYQ